MREPFLRMRDGRPRDLPSGRNCATSDLVRQVGLNGIAQSLLADGLAQLRARAFEQRVQVHRRAGHCGR